MTDEAARASAVITGAYAFTKNLLVAMIADLVRQGADDARIEQVLQDVGRANERIPEGLGRDLADTMTSHALALVLMMRDERTSGDRPTS